MSAATVELQPLRLLLVEDNAEDAELVLLELRRAGFDVAVQRVENELAFRASLNGEVDLILSDYALPQFNGIRALQVLSDLGFDIPFILVSGTIGEEIAVAAMKLGAADYLLKDRLGRLGSAVSQAIERSRVRTEGRRTIEALRASEERFRQLADNIEEVFWIADENGARVIYISPAYEKIWGRTCESLLSNPEQWIEAVHPADAVRIRAARASRLASGLYDETFRIVRPDLTIRWIRDRAFAVKNPSDSVARMVGVAEDISQRKELEAQFLRAQRMEAIGTLAGGLAHDLNNILAPVLMAAGLLKDRAADGQDRAMLEMMEQSSQRGAAIIRQLLTFSRGIEGEKSPVEIQRLLKEIVNIIRETFPREITLVDESVQDLWPVVADATQLHQVFVNLCVNARDAMPDGGQITLSAKNVELTALEVARRPDVKAGTYVRVTVADTGTGIPPDLLARIFDPFFTTKEIGKGTGLGLSTVLGILRSHAGFIDVQSEPSKGAAFSVYLPATNQPAVQAAESLKQERPLSGKGETILVVDDEEAIREATQRLLTGHNFKVLTAVNGQDAIMVFLENRTRVRLVLTDVMMPTMGGLALVRALQVLDPEIRCIAITGMETRKRKAEFAALGITQVLSKPCSPRPLLEAIDRELHRPGETVQESPADWR